MLLKNNVITVHVLNAKTFLHFSIKIGKIILQNPCQTICILVERIHLRGDANDPHGLMHR